HPLAPLQHLCRQDPAGRQLPGHQQLPKQPGVAAVGLGPMLATTGRLSIGRLGQVRLEPRGLDLLDYTAPPVQPSTANPPARR
ncbi:MAG TPA: hypothetical protein VE466_14080, partial [Acidimicrobiales bacterium]|nr:hypothetical protein [Acidimicrobiales bacterium]